jgi:hypothetical protein
VAQDEKINAASDAAAHPIKLLNFMLFRQTFLPSFKQLTGRVVALPFS